MQALEELQVGAIFWAGGDPLERIRGLKEIGIRCGQLGIPGDAKLDGMAAAWKPALEKEAFTVVTLVAAYDGEDYADGPTIERTVGFIPRAFREEREQRTLAISDLAADLGVPGIACHVGFVPEDTQNPDYIAVRDMVQRICDYAAKKDQTFALETGQEPAPVLNEFIADVDRPNLKVNFDPANMILYGTGDPIEALGVVAPHVITVHCKDGNWPPKNVPKALGTEMPLGQGAVGMERFIAKLKEIGYQGPLNIEREGVSPEQWTSDVKAAVKLLESLR